MILKWFVFLVLLMDLQSFGKTKDVISIIEISKLNHAPSLRVLQEAKKQLNALQIYAPKILTVIDYQLPSSKPRFWVIDLIQKKILYQEYVAHGRNTGMKFAKKFSNTQNSKQTSLGVFRTLGTYLGKHGYSLRLQGLQKGVNDNAFKRAIVMHGADYVSESFLKKHGRLGRSWGCPALDRRVSKKIIETIKGGTYLFAYY